MPLKEQNQTNLFEELTELVAKLRKECPWDREQDQQSLKPFLLEEVLEFLEALDSGDPTKLKEELGDLLLMVLLYCEVSRPITLAEVMSGTIQKMKTRHPHVFGTEKLTSSEEVIERWEEIKRKTRREIAETPLGKAASLNDRAIEKGFNPPSLDEMIEKLNEEADELRCASTRTEKKEESGDLLFTAVNICRMLKVDPESALLESCVKFENRLEKVFNELESKGETPETTGFEKMDKIWDRLKQS